MRRRDDDAVAPRPGVPARSGTLERRAHRRAAPTNETHFDDPRYNSLYAEALATVDLAKRTEIIHEMQAIEYDSGGYIIPYFPPVIDAYAKNVHGAQSSKVGVPMNNYDLKQLWLG